MENELVLKNLKNYFISDCFQIRVDFFWKPTLFVTAINRSPGDGSATSATAYNPGMRLWTLPVTY